MTANTIHIQTLFIKHFIGRRSTDHQYYWKLKQIERKYPIHLHSCNSVSATFMANVSKLISYIMNRAHIDLSGMNPKLWALFRHSIFIPNHSIVGKCDVVFTNFFFPVNSINLPLIFEYDFFIFGLPSEQDIVRRAIYVPESFIERAKIVCVRHDLSLASYRTMFPQYADKAVIIPFYLPWLEAIPEKDIYHKFEGVKNGVIKVLFVGNLARLKGLPYLIEAYNLLKEKYKKLELTVVSVFRDGPVDIPPEVKTFSNLKPADVYKLMAESHIFAMVSRRDATGTVYWEAMANGCALLVPDISPQREMFGPFGLTAHPTNTDDIVNALEQMITNRDFCLSRALLSRKVFQEKFHHSVVANQYYEVFRKAAFE